MKTASKPRTGTIKLQTHRESDRLSDAVYETLTELILSGELTPGSVVSELALSRQLKVSRTPIHDALRQLTKDGLVAQEANHRAVIAAFNANDVFDIFDMRKLLETEAARRAAVRIDRGSLAELRKMADSMAAHPESSPSWVAQWADFDETFHSVIAEASGSQRLAQDIARYRRLHRCFNRMSTTPKVLRQALAEHVGILDALDARDGEAAARRMAAHIHEWQAYFVSRFRQA